MHASRSGSVLLVTLMFLAIFSLLAQQLYQASIAQHQLSQVLRFRGQAQDLALAGVQLAIAQLTPATQETQPSKNEKSDVAHGKQKQLLRQVLPHLNKWQTFTLEQAIDGISGQVGICVSSEDGKININRAFDITSGKFREPYRTLLARLTFDQPALGKGEILRLLEEYLSSKGQESVSDIAELLRIEKLHELLLDYIPPGISVLDNKPYEGSVSLRDMFTVWTKHPRIEPWLLSNSLCRLLGLRAPAVDDAQKQATVYEHVIDNFTPTLGKKWSEHWSVLAPLYNGDQKTVTVDYSLFTQEFDPGHFSVLSWGKVHDIEQRLSAVIARKQTQNGQEPAYEIERIYWL